MSNADGLILDSAQEWSLVEMVLASGIDLFTDSTGIPRLKRPTDGADDFAWPVDSRVSIAYLSKCIYGRTRKLPRGAEVMSLVRVLEGLAFDNMRRDVADFELIERDPVLRSIIRLLNTSQRWKGPASQLLPTLRSEIADEGIDLSRDPTWPRDPARLSCRLRDLGQAFAKLGIQHSKSRTGRLRAHILERIRDLSHPDDAESSPSSPDWASRLSAINRISVCGAVLAEFNVDKGLYEIPVSAQLENLTGALYIVGENVDERTALFDGISSYVFKSDAPKWVRAAFERAVLMDLPEQDSDKGEVAPDEDEENTVSGESDGGTKNDLGESRQTHGRRPDQGSHNVPKPQELSKEGAVNGVKEQDSRRFQLRTTFALEEQHKQQLKEMYAWHCQLCLAIRTPATLAPVGSYVHCQDNRRCLIKAHHPDQVHAGGARHGGNLLVICEFHHGEIGDAISGLEITKVLGTLLREECISFWSEDGKDVRLNGVLVEIPIATAGAFVPCFFAHEHREYWLRHGQ